MPLPLMATAAAGRLRWSTVVISPRSATTAVSFGVTNSNNIVSSLPWRRIAYSSQHIPVSRATFTTLSNHSALAQDNHSHASSSSININNSDDNQQGWRSRVIVTSSPEPYTTLTGSSSAGPISSSAHQESESDSESDTDNSNNKENDQRYVKRKVKFTPEMDQEILRLREEKGLSWSAIGSQLGVPYRGCHRRYTSLLDPKLKESWPEEKVRRLDEMVVEGKTWSEIAKELNDTSSSCQAKWKSMVKPKEAERNRVFDTLQSKVLLQLVKEHGQDDWKAVMRGFMLRLGGRDMAKVTPEQLRHQYYCLKRKPTRYWSLNEETALIQHVLKHGTGQWDMISEALKYHSPEQCKEKWTMLDMSTKMPKVKSWYKTEQANFWRLWQRYGEDWELIARSMPKRTGEQCEAFFNKATAGLDRTNEESFNKGVKSLAETMSQYRTLSWSKENSERLWAVADECKTGSTHLRINWNIVAERMGMGLTPAQYKHHHYYLRTVRIGGLSGLWTDAEIKKLEMAVQKEGRNWTLIASQYFPHRNSKSLCHKFNSIRNKGQYITEEEYDTLLGKVDLQEQAFKQQIQALGSSLSASSEATTFKPDWEEIAKAMPGATWTAEQCKDAYDGSFKHHLKNSKWTPEEDSQLLKAAKMMGRKNWVGVAAAVAGKNSWECRMRLAELHEPLVEGTEALPGLVSKNKEQVVHVTVD
ncbi:Myblike DNAbinding domain-containing protein [Mortierella sp. 14UC]|nr:Myblike DNAbinding domain-containing protein [Mortierella sp. 14UC]